MATVVFITRRSRRLHNAKHEREPSERSVETRRDVVHVDLWVATAKGTRRKGGWKRGGGRGGSSRGERPCLCRRSAARFTVTGTERRPD